ncbi:MAG: GntR family transcriptional regulator [Alicyclobacillus sp.]|nr:GntR family transcriptional regulator [Alicyclobacillus sp.]
MQKLAAGGRSELAERIRADIMNGRLLPNQRLIEAELSERYQAGRAAVRMALVELENEQLVVREPNRGARVRAITLEEALEVTEVRAALEELIAAKAAERVTEEQAQKLLAVVERMKKAQVMLDIVQYSQANRDLHQQLYEYARHETAYRVLENLRAQVVRYQFRVSLMPGRMDVSLREHTAIVEAVVRRDPEAARVAMRAHMASVMSALRQMPKEGLY